MKGLYKRCGCDGWDRCQHAWWLQFTHKGERHRLPANDFAKREVRTKGDGVKVLEDFRSAVRSGAYSKDPLPYSFPDFCTYYEEKYRDVKGLRSQADVRKLDLFRRRFAEYSLEDMTRPEPFEQFLNVDCKNNKPATRNRYRALLRAMLKWAKKRDLIKEHPFEKDLLPFEREMNERTRRLLPEEEERLLAVADDELRDAVILTLDTGLRRGALFALEARDVDFKQQLLRVRPETQKHAEGQEIPLTTRAIEILKRRAVLGRPLFSTLESRFSKTWYRTLRKAALKDKDLHWHDLRAEFASRLGERGVRLEVGSKLLGHKNLKTTMRYMRPQLEDFQNAIRKLEIK